MNLIVGGTGFIGGHLAEQFFGEGEISKGIFRKGSHLRIMDKYGIQCIEADLMDRHTLHEPLDMVDVVYSLASPPPGSPQDEYDKFNNVGLQNLLEEADEHGVKMFVHLSTLDVYGFGAGHEVDGLKEPMPTTTYQRAKLDGEKIVTGFAQKHPELQVRVVRAARAVGSRDQTLVTPVLRMIEQGKVTLPAGGTDNTMSFTHPRDIAQALLKAASSPVVDAKTPLVKSFDATVAEVSAALIRSIGKDATVKQQGRFSGGSPFPQYTAEQMKAGLRLKGQEEAWKKISYVPAYGLEGMAAEVATWYRKEPWVTKNLT
jgi:dihydroflavonol-4-reductase